MAATTTAIVLSAGASRRMGRSKLLLPFRDTTVLGATVTGVAASTVDRVIIVAGPATVTLASNLADDRIAMVENPDPARGNMSSLKVATDSDRDAAFFVLVPGDLPTVETAVINASVHAARSHDPWAIVTAYRDRIAHPFVLSRAAVVEFGDRTGSKVLWQVLVESQDPRVQHLEVDECAPLDVNTPSDYAQLSNHQAD